MKIGLYGGTFSPPHKAHVRAALLFSREAGLDLLYVMPSGKPPHKSEDTLLPAECRLEMARLAFDGVGMVSDYEIKKEGRSYTVETLRYLREKHPDDELFMLVGEDMFFCLDRWREPLEIMELCTVVVMMRTLTELSIVEETAEKYRKKYGAKVQIIDEEPIDVSSSDVRDWLSRGETVRGLVPDAVCEYIENNGLYNNEQ